MNTDAMLRTIAVVLIALVPACLRLWWGRSIARAVDDPALPERLMALRRRSVIVMIGTLAALATVSVSDLYWTVPLFIVSRFAAAYPVRKALFGETWSLAGYAWFYARLVIAVFGFWVLLLNTPVLAMRAGSFDWLAGLAIAGVLLLWNRNYAAVVRRLLGGSPVQDPLLTSRFAGLVAATGLPMPAFEQLNLSGGVVANALAVPSLRQSAVVITDTVATFDPDEVAAICAHELGHLEHYNPRRLRRLNVANVALIAAAPAVAPAMRLTVSDASGIVSIVWAIAIFGVLLARGRDRQKQETASDARAIALTGNPEALIRALTRLNAIARLPRRWDPQFERQATHPSLARRIQAIRAAAGTPAAAFGSPSAFVRPDGGVSVTFDRDHVQWTEGDLATHTLSYAGIVDLRLEPQTSGQMVLVLVERGGRRWTVPLKRDDVARAQAVLDSVDARLAPGSEPASVQPTAARLVAAIAAMIAMTGMQTGLLLTSLLAALQPTAAMLRAAGAAMIAAAVLLLFGSSSLTGANFWWSPALVRTTYGNFWWWSAVANAACGLVLIGIAYANRNEPANPRATRFIGVLAIGTVAAFAAAFTGGSSLVRLHQTARAWSAAALLPIALGAALVGMQHRLVRAASIAIMLAGVGLGFAGTRTFLYGFVNDPFLGSSEPAAVHTIASRAGSEFSVPFAVETVRLSPGRDQVAVSSQDDEEKITFYVGPVAGPFVSIEADDVLFINDARVLAVSERPAETIVRAIALRSPRRPIWEQSIPRLYTSQVSLDDRRARWRMTGARRDGTIVRIDGAVDGSDVQERHWDAPPGHLGWYSAIASLGNEAFAVESWYSPRMLSARAFSTAYAGWAPLVQPNPMRTRMWVLDTKATHVASSDFDPRCNGQRRDGRPVCMAFDGFRTQVVTVDVQTRRLVPLLWLDGRALAYGATSPGWIAGWWRGEPFALDLDAHQVMRGASSGEERTTRIVVRDDALTTIAWSGSRSTVRMYPLNTH